MELVAGLFAYNPAVSHSIHEPGEPDLKLKADAAGAGQAGGNQRRLLGLDVGLRRIGMAVSDPLGLTAQGIPTLQRKNNRTDLAAFEGILRQHSVGEIVVGYPLLMSGEEGSQAGKVRAFGDLLRATFKIPVHLWDERLSSVEANRVLRQSAMSIEKRGKAVDQLAAVLILQSFMDSRRV
jgi:putative Holliday junction resolvase